MGVFGFDVPCGIDEALRDQRVDELEADSAEQEHRQQHAFGPLGPQPAGQQVPLASRQNGRRRFLASG
jgi:hypothetical protein